MFAGKGGSAATAGLNDSDLKSSVNTPKKKGGGKRPRLGRTDKGGQEAVINQILLMQKLPHLVKLVKAKEAAAEDLSEAVKKVAEQTGYFAKVVLRRAKAEAGEDYADQQKEARQLSLIFEVDTPFLKG